MILLICTLIVIIIFWYLAKKRKKSNSYKQPKPTPKQVVKSKEEVYADLLKRQEWLDLKTAILTRDNYKCVWCKSTKNIQVHHKVYYKTPDNKYVNPWDYPLDKLITLCGKCHTWWHKTHPNKVYYRKSYQTQL